MEILECVLNATRVFDPRSVTALQKKIPGRSQVLSFMIQVFENYKRFSFVVVALDDCRAISFFISSILFCQSLSKFIWVEIFV